MKLVTQTRFSRLINICDFNPHEREARDLEYGQNALCALEILIHTSVKLVTPSLCAVPPNAPILIHTSVKLVTGESQAVHALLAQF